MQYYTSILFGNMQQICIFDHKQKYNSRRNTNRNELFVEIRKYVFDWMMRLAMTNIGSLPLMAAVRVCLGWVSGSLLSSNKCKHNHNHKYNFTKIHKYKYMSWKIGCVLICTIWGIYYLHDKVRCKIENCGQDHPSIIRNKSLFFNVKSNLFLFLWRQKLCNITVHFTFTCSLSL